MKEIIFYIHGIGKNNNVEDICKKIEKQLKTPVVPIIWYQLFDIYETNFIQKYNDIMNYIRKWSVYYVGDIIVYEKMKNIVFEKLNEKFKEYENYNINIVAHSLGSVIVSDYLYDRKDLKVKNLFTVGSPLALYSLRYGIENFDKPILNIDNWINIWNEYDAVSYPLKNMNLAYELAVDNDICLNCGNFITKFFKLAHLSYFRDNEFYETLQNYWKL